LGDDFLNDAVPAQPVATAQARLRLQWRKLRNFGAMVADLESSLGDFPAVPVAQAAAPVAPLPIAPPIAPREIGIAASAAATPASNMPVAPKAPPAPVAQAAVAPSAPIDPAAVDLSGMFSDLRQELEEDVAKAEEDPETHYNLGVAFREMGLLDEAIGELQKVCQAVERGHVFPQ